MAAWTAPAGHVILSAHAHEFRVSSDHAWIDSGSGFVVYTWDGRREHSHEVRTGWEAAPGHPHPEMPTPNATEADRRAHTAWIAARAYISTVYDLAEAAHMIQRGVTVEVVRGRKVPKGKYEVADHANGQHGPYVNLRDGSGIYHRYVAVGNVRVLADYKKEFRKKCRRNGEVEMLTMVAESGWTAAAWGILADYAEDNDWRVSSGNNELSGAEFAIALRGIVTDVKDDMPKFSTYLAYCHNEFRHPFSGI